MPDTEWVLRAPRFPARQSRAEICGYLQLFLVHFFHFWLIVVPLAMWCLKLQRHERHCKVGPDQSHFSATTFARSADDNGSPQGEVEGT